MLQHDSFWPDLSFSQRMQTSHTSTCNLFIRWASRDLFFVFFFFKTRRVRGKTIWPVTHFTFTFRGISPAMPTMKRWNSFVIGVDDDWSLWVTLCVCSARSVTDLKRHFRRDFFSWWERGYWVSWKQY
jgi:hypothetical protein